MARHIVGRPTDPNVERPKDGMRNRLRGIEYLLPDRLPLAEQAG